VWPSTPVLTTALCSLPHRYAELHALFQALDKDGDGTVTSKEWGAAVSNNKELLGQYFGGATAKEIGMAYKRLDLDGSGDLSWEEFVKGAQAIRAVSSAEALSAGERLALRVLEPAAEPAVDEPAVDEPAVDAAEDLAAVDEPAVDEPAVDEPAVDAAEDLAAAADAAEDDALAFAPIPAPNARAAAPEAAQAAMAPDTALVAAPAAEAFDYHAQDERAVLDEMKQREARRVQQLAEANVAEMELINEKMRLAAERRSEKEARQVAERAREAAAINAKISAASRPKGGDAAAP
jgi:hypothetical protein